MRTPPAILLILAFLSGCTIPSESSTAYLKLRDQALDQMRSANYSRARETLKQILSKFPDHPLNLDMELLLSGCERELGNEEEAYRIRERVARQADAKDLKLRANVGLAMIDFQRERYNKAAEKFLAASKLEDEPNMRARRMYQGGLALQRSGQFEGARKTYQQVIQLAPDSQAARRAQVQLLYPDNFAVQTGAFRQLKNAREQKELLSKNGFPTEVVEFKLPQGTLHCVRVGNFRDRASAVALRERLISANILDEGIRIVVRP